MAFITPDNNCGCCVIDPCDQFACSDGNVPPSTSFRSVDAITITLTNPVTTNLHLNFGANPNLAVNPTPPVPKVYNHRWLHVTDLSAILGNYVLPRVTEEQCFGNTLIVTDIPFDGATIYGSTAVDGSNCPSGTITSWPAVALSAVTWKVTAKWGSGFGLDILAVLDQPGGGGFSNGKELGRGDVIPPIYTDPELVTAPAFGLQFLLPRADIICAGGVMNLFPIPGPVGGSLPPCTGYPATPGILASYTLSP